MIKLAVSGAMGRMGQTITSLALKQDQTFALTTLLEHKDHPKANESIHDIKIQIDNNALAECDALIEFTLPEGTIDNLNACVKHNVKMIIGTTGFTGEQLAQIQEASQKIPIVFASNMSIGVNILFKLIEISSAKIGANKIDITETHHIHKKDKPSGTAKTMGEIAEKSSGQAMNSIESLRKGEVIGDHTITFDSPEDILTISHHAKDRSMFAKGALTATEFLRDKQNGLFNMQDVLGLNTIS